MLLGFKTEINPNKTQLTLLAQNAGVARHAWNWGLALTKQILEHNKISPDEKIKFPSAIDLHKWLVAIVKRDNPWYYESSKWSPQNALRALSDAWQRCFKKVAGSPKFKKKGRNDKFTLDGSITVGHQKIKIPNLGWVKTFERLPQGISPKSVTLSKKGDRWFISFRIEVEPTNPEKSVDVVGVDLGIKTLATLSTGETFQGSKPYKIFESKLSRLQRLSRHKTIGSNNWRKAQLKIANLHRKIANIRKDTLHKLTSYLTKNHGLIVIEDLNVSGMMANHCLAKAIQDMGFYEFRRQLTYKTELYGSKLVVVDRWFPSSKTCSNCGVKKDKLTLSDRIFNCDSCGFEIDRDLNASINLAKAGS